NGRIFYIALDEVKQGQQAEIKELMLNIDGKNTSFAEMFDHKKVDIRFGRDHQGELWLSSKIDGKLYRDTGMESRRQNSQGHLTHPEYTTFKNKLFHNFKGSKKQYFKICVETSKHAIKLNNSITLDYCDLLTFAFQISIPALWPS